MVLSKEQQKLPDDDLIRSKHVGVILSVFKVFYVKVMQVQSLVDNRSDSTKMYGATIRFRDVEVFVCGMM